jgi:hypothetical protein
MPDMASSLLLSNEMNESLENTIAALTNQNFLWASMIWGTVAGGYLLYGWKQKASVPMAAGGAMTLMSFWGPNALIMSLVCIGIGIVTWWLCKRGY